MMVSLINQVEVGQGIILIFQVRTTSNIIIIKRRKVAVTTIVVEMIVITEVFLEL